MYELSERSSAAHVSRGYCWFITKDGGAPKQRISRAQLKAKPFFEDFYTQVP